MSTNKDQLRNSIMTQEQLVASRRRFGLFSQPPPLAVGDDGQYKQKKHARGSDGKPITQPRQLLAGPLKSGHSKSSYFNTMESIHQGDPYKNQYKRQITYYNTMHKRSPMHQKEFKPSSGPKTLNYPAYQYIEEKQKRKDHPQKGQNGKPKTKDRNFITNLTSKIDNDLMKFPKHIPDPYERKKQLQKQDRDIWRKKLPEQVYNTMSHSHGAFSKTIQAYGEDQKAKSLLKSKSKTSRKILMSTVQHEKRFKLGMNTHGRPIGKYPQFIGKLTSESVDVIRVKKGNSDQASWKPNNFGLSKPSPSISLHSLNIKKR